MDLVAFSEERAEHAWRGVALNCATQLQMLAAGQIFTVGERVVHLASWMMPTPARFYVHPQPVGDYGDGVEMGVAYFVYPGGGSAHERAKHGLPPVPGHKPKTFVCNVGHMQRTAPSA